MTNHTPPKACLADFGFTTVVFDPREPMSSSFTLEGGTMIFMAPELLAPSKYHLEKVVPTREGDIYAFALVILQVVTLYRRQQVAFLTICQVLMGEYPFRDIRAPELAYRVPLGARPPKPENAEAIGISESFWEFIQKCWDGDPRRRPQIQEVVEGVGNAAANWRITTPPNAIEHREDSEDSDSEEMAHVGEFSLVPVVPPVLEHFVQWRYSGLITVMTRKS